MNKTVICQQQWYVITAHFNLLIDLAHIYAEAPIDSNNNYFYYIINNDCRICSRIQAKSQEPRVSWVWRIWQSFSTRLV